MKIEDVAILSFGTIDKIFDTAYETAKRSTCQRKKVGATLFDIGKERIVGYGYGGSLVPCKECLRDKEEWRQDGCWSVHAEMRAIKNCIAVNIIADPASLVMFVTHGPCDQCLKHMEFFGITTVVYDVPYHDNWKKWLGRMDVYSREELNELL